MVHNKILLALTLAVIVVGVGAGVYMTNNQPSFYVVSASFTQSSWEVSMVLSITTEEEIIINTPSSALFKVEVIGNQGDFWVIDSIALMVVTIHHIGPGTVIKEYTGTLYQTVKTFAPLQLPDSITFVVHMSKDFTTPEYTLNLK